RDLPRKRSNRRQWTSNHQQRQRFCCLLKCHRSRRFPSALYCARHSAKRLRHVAAGGGLMRLELSCAKLPAFIRALKLAAPEHLKRAFGKALYRIGKADTEKMRTEGLSALNIHSKGFRNSFKFKATDSREAKSINELTLTEYTGAKPFRIFQTGGDIEPRKSRTLTILTGAARSANGKRKYTQKELQDLINSGKAKIIKTKAGPAVVQV